MGLFKNFFKNPFKATAAGLGLKKQYKRLTGEDQKEKAHERLRWAQNAYNEAGRLKNEYETGIIPQIKKLEEAFTSAIRSRGNYDLKLSGYQLTAGDLEHAIKNREQKLEHIGSDISRQTSEYESALAKHKEEVDKFHSEGSSLQGLVDVFKRETPEFAKKIEEYQNLPRDFLGSFEEAKKKRASLEGFTRDERGSEIEEYESGVETLKQKRELLEKAIKEQYVDLTGKHQELTERGKNLTTALKQYRNRQDELISKENIFKSKQNELEKIIGGYREEENKYKVELEKAKQMKANYDLDAKAYTDNENYIKELGNQANHYRNITDDYQNKINHQLAEAEKFEGLAQSHAKKAGKIAKLNLIGGTLLGGMIGLGGNGLIGGLAGGVLGGLGGHLANKMSGLNKKFPTINVPDTNINQDRFRDLQSILTSGLEDGRKLGKNAPISSGMLGNVPKINIPELGGWQSPAHFGMPQMPDIHELPTLESALGRLKDPSELKDLTLGLPSLTGKEGKKYNFAVLYDPAFISKFKNVMKKAQGVKNNFISSNRGKAYV